MTPTLRLASSRHAIAQQLLGDGAPASQRGTAHAGVAGDGSDTGSPVGHDPIDGSNRPSWWGTCSDVIATWWKYHPAHIALDLASPAISRRVREKPVQMLALAAGAGAIVAITRPWRLVSVTGIALALLKSSRLPGTLMTLLATQGLNPQGTAHAADHLGEPRPPPPE